MDDEEKVDQKAQNEAIKSTKEIFKKKTKNKVKQIIMHAVKAALVPVMMMLLKILMITLLITSIISAITVTIFGDGGSDNNEEKEETLDTEYTAETIGDFVVKVDAEGSPIAPTRENLEYIIENYGFYSNDYGDAKANYTEMLDTILTIQEDKKINALFTMAICQKESSGGLNELTAIGNNCMSLAAFDEIEGKTFWCEPNHVTGSWEEQGLWQKFETKSACIEAFSNNIENNNYYFAGGNYTVNSIGKMYCGDEDSWKISVNNFIKEFYSLIGIQTEGTIDPQTGVSTYTSSSGRTYKNYKQCLDEYANVLLANCTDTNLKEAGCALVSTAIIASGFDLYEANVLEVNSYYKALGEKDGSNGLYHQMALNHYTGKTWTYINSWNKQAVIEQLKAGYPVEVHVNAGPRTSGEWGSHYFTLLDIKADESQIYVSDPAFRDTSTTYTGWVDISVLDGSLGDVFDGYFKVE